MRCYIAIVVAAVMGAGCGSGDSRTQRTLTCLFSANGVCENMVGRMSDDDQRDLQDSCDLLGGAFSVGACSTTSTVAGHCERDEGGGVTMEIYYYTTSNWTLPTAQGDCTGRGGTWVP
jgi:hypothetical protein